MDGHISTQTVRKVAIFASLSTPEYFVFVVSLQACLIADVVQHFVDAKLEFDTSYIYEDVNRAIQHVHRSGFAHRGILADPHRYLVKNVSSTGSSFFFFFFLIFETLY